MENTLSQLSLGQYSRSLVRGRVLAGSYAVLSVFDSMGGAFQGIADVLRP